MFKICTSYFAKIVLHFVYKNYCGLFVIKYMEHWNWAVWTYVIDPVSYISKVFKLYAFIIGLIGSLIYCFSFQSQMQYHS